MTLDQDTSPDTQTGPDPKAAPAPLRVLPLLALFLAIVAVAASAFYLGHFLADTTQAPSTGIISSGLSASPAATTPPSDNQPESSPDQAAAPAPQAPPEPLTSAPTWTANRTVVAEEVREALKAKNLVAAKKLLDAHRGEAGNDPAFSDLEMRYESVRLKAREAELLVELHNTSSRNYARQAELYDELASLNPRNKSYLQKRDTFRKKLAERHYKHAYDYLKDTSRTKPQHVEALRRIHEALTLFPQEQRYLSMLAKLERDALLFPEGDGVVELAVEDEGWKKSGRRIYVWIYNMGDAPIDVRPDAFILTDATGQAVPPAKADGFEATVRPGKVLHGRMIFADDQPPRSIAFAYADGVSVQREFPAR